MAKKKRAGTSRKTAGRRKTASRAKRTRKRTTRARANQVDLKALRKQIVVSVARLDALATREGVQTEEVRRRLMAMTADIDELCAVEPPDGCGPHMVFPAESEA